MHKTLEEIKSFAEAIEPESYPGSNSSDDFYVKIITQSPTQILFEVTKMYTSPKLGLKELKAWSEFFDTDNIDKYDDISESGCDTCDYGSRYGYVIRVWK